jgi:hypothetical protein
VIVEIVKKFSKNISVKFPAAFSIGLVFFLTMSCFNKDNKQINNQPSSTLSDENENLIKAKPAPEWAKMLKHNSGWIGADGIYSVALNGVETRGKADSIESFFWFSDSIIGEIVNDSLKDDWEMVHNSVAYMEGKTPDPSKIKFYWRKDEQGQAKSVFEPNTPQTDPGDYYWLGDGVFNHAMDSTIYIFAYRIKNVPGQVFPFKDVGVSLIALPKESRPPFPNQRQMDTPLFLNDNQGRGKIVFGASVLPNTEGSGALNPDGYIYIYGLRGSEKELLVARVKDNAFEDFSQWRCWDGMEWNNDVHQSKALTSRVSNEMSVSFMEDGRVIAAYQLDTNSPNVVVQVGDTPAGPFYPLKMVWETPEIYEDIDFYTYNAKAFPHLSEPGELLISYNVNAFNFLEKLHKHPHHLRPRFITVKYN